MSGKYFTKLIGLDTNVFIYQFEKHPVFSSQTRHLFKDLRNGKFQAVTSVITFIEVLSLPADDERIDQLQDLMLETPNLSVQAVTFEIALKAAQIRRIYKFRTSDAIQLATAVHSKADVFITNDKRLKLFKEIKIQLL